VVYSIRVNLFHLVIICIVIDFNEWSARIASKQRKAN